MSKSLFKLPFINREVLIQSFKKKKKNVCFFQRNSNVPFCFANSELLIHNGLFLKRYTYRKQQFGFKLGEFSKTRKNAGHKGKRLVVSKKRPKVVSSVFKYDLKRKFFL